MERSIGEHVTDSSQPCRKGAIRGNITALEAAYEEYRIEYETRQQAAVDARIWGTEVSV